MHIPDLFCVILLADLGSCRLHLHGKLYVNMCSVELPIGGGGGGGGGGGLHAMNNVLTKWHIALSINIGVLENH